MSRLLFDTVVILVKIGESYIFAYYLCYKHSVSLKFIFVVNHK
jgi:hypothetical protein